MKIVNFKPQFGRIKLRIDSIDDLWYLSQVVSAGDKIKAKSVRRIKEKDDKLRSGGGERKTITLTVSVERSEFKSGSDSLRLSGVIVEGPEDLVSLGSHHTVTVEPGSLLEVIKEKWSKMEVGRLRDAEKATLQPKFLVVAVDEGEAVLGLVRSSKIDYFELSRNIGGKYFTKDREARKTGFYKELKDVITNTTGKEGVVNVVLAGAGFEKENFHRFISENPFENELNIVLENTGSHGKRAVVEVLKKGKVAKLLGDLDSARDINFMEEVMEKIGKGEGLSSYGLKEVSQAVSFGAVEKLLVSDIIFTESRKKIEPVMNEVKKTNGFVHIINHDSEAGNQLDALGGIAATLRYAIQ